MGGISHEGKPAGLSRSLSLAASRIPMVRSPRSLSDIAFVTRRRRYRQMQGRRPGKTGGVFTGIRWGFFRAENDADGCGSFAAV